MDISGEIIALLFLVILSAISYRKWKGVGSHWGKLRRHGGDRDTFESIECIAMGVFYLSCYNIIFMLINMFFKFPYAYSIDIFINACIFVVLFTLAKKAIKKHELRGKKPEIVQTIIGTFYLGFIGAEFWLKHNAPQFLVKLIERVI